MSDNILRTARLLPAILITLAFGPGEPLRAGEHDLPLGSGTGSRALEVSAPSATADGAPNDTFPPEQGDQASSPEQTPAAARASAQTPDIAVRRRGVRLRGLTVTSGGAAVSEGQLLDRSLPIVMANEFLRITLPDPGRDAHFSSATVELRRSGGWQTATATRWGDWLYYGNSITMPATEVEVVSLTEELAVVRWSFWAHVIPARGSLPPVRYPFERTIYLRAGESGYFSHVRPLSFPLEHFATEHEIGWGGIWGPAKISTFRERIRTETLTSTVRFNLNKDPDAVVFDAEADDLRRMIVPVPGAEFIIPHFGGGHWGSVYVHEVGKSITYGAYLYVAPRSEALPVREVCELAWDFGPAVGVWGRPDLSRCGRDW